MQESTTERMMSTKKIFLLFVTIFTTWTVVFVTFYNFTSGILFGGHRHAMQITHTTVVDKGLQSRTLNRSSVIDVQNLVNKRMKPWETIQIFSSDVDPGDMTIKKRYKDLRKSRALNLTYWIEQPVQSCALVGNSGILLNSRCGEVIDDADVVFRMNLAVFGKEYTSDVGSKVTFMTINGLQIKDLVSCFKPKVAENKPAKINITEYLSKLSSKCKTYYDRLKVLKRDHVMMPTRGHFSELLNVLPILRKQLHFNFSVSYNPKNLITVSERLWHLVHPSSGIGAYTAATQLCEDITLYGFYPFHKDPYNRTILHHYYEPKVKINYTSNCHKMPEEYKFLIDLEKRGVIRMVNNCTSLKT